MVYVDKCQIVGLDSETFPFHSSCHLIADTMIDLEEFARSMDLKREWIQKSGTVKEHYDLTHNRQKTAMKKGAMLIGRKELVRIILAPERVNTYFPVLSSSVGAYEYIFDRISDGMHEEKILEERGS